VVAAGVTDTLLPVKLPGIHVYDAPPVAVSVVLLPLQIEAGAALAVIVGSGVTVKINVAVLVQPAVVPLTV
jgi:hypothetical protein